MLKGGRAAARAVKDMALSGSAGRERTPSICVASGMRDWRAKRMEAVPVWLVTYGRHVTRWPMEIALARDPALLLAWLGMRLFIAEIALIVGLESTGAIRLSVLVLSAVVLGYATLLAIHALSLRLLIYPDEVRVSSHLLRRRYRLEPGDAVRHPVAPKRGAFKSQLGNFGIELGRGRMPSGEPVDIVRLAPLPSVIVIRCVSILLAVAPSSERALLLALDKARLSRVDAAKVIQH